MKRRRAKTIRIGNCLIGGDNPVAIQSMTKTKTSDIQRTVRQIRELEAAGCEIVRLAIKDEKDAQALKRIKERASIPLVADIHFNWRLALAAIDSGADKIRLNPGNIYKKKEIGEISRAAKLNNIPIRVGINSGSLRGSEPKNTGSRTQADRMVKSALDYIKILEGFKFRDIVISLKASNIIDTIGAYRKIARLCDYPLHLGVTATGSPYAGTIKSAIALGILLSEGIGDTIRVSLTDAPAREVTAAKAVLESLGLRKSGPEIISCPTCGRCEVDLVRVVKELEGKLSGVRYPLSAHRPLKIAVMGCVVNGPGEAKEADAGIAFGKKEGLLFRNGRAIKKVPFSGCVAVLLKEIELLNAKDN
ncbi:MAG: flavodoxin-dependent (E)-4-hydroxy-3-methylbut-2-enyl-diphosphate synthase [Candidatus Omnitrophota bacterium]